jgi:hypothetical protein
VEAPAAAAAVAAAAAAAVAAAVPAAAEDGSQFDAATGSQFQAVSPDGRINTEAWWVEQPQQLTDNAGRFNSALVVVAGRC